jgi:hypothetical protein
MANKIVFQTQILPGFWCVGGSCLARHKWHTVWAQPFVSATCLHRKQTSGPEIGRHFSIILDGGRNLFQHFTQLHVRIQTFFDHLRRGAMVDMSRNKEQKPRTWQERYYECWYRKALIKLERSWKCRQRNRPMTWPDVEFIYFSYSTPS